MGYVKRPQDMVMNKTEIITRRRGEGVAAAQGRVQKGKGRGGEGRGR